MWNISFLIIAQESGKVILSFALVILITNLKFFHEFYENREVYR